MKGSRARNVPVREMNFAKGPGVCARCGRGLCLTIFCFYFVLDDGSDRVLK